MPLTPLSRLRWLTWDRAWIPIALSTAFLVRAALGYRPFPSVDDFAYVPLAWHWLDPSLFPKDELLTGFGNHQVAYTALVAVGEATVGLSWSFFLFTLLLTALTLLGLARLMRTFGAKGFFLPFVVALCVAVMVRGLGRGDYDGLLGDALHGQWIAIVFSLFAFDALLRDRPAVAGALLGLAAYGQPMLALHSAVAVLCAGLLVGRAGLRSTVDAGAAAVVVSLPLLYVLGTALSGGGGPAGPVDWDAIAEAYAFRAPHHYDLKPHLVALGVLLVATGAGAFARFADITSVRDRHAAGLYLGLTGLFLASVCLYWACRAWLPSSVAVTAYLLDLTRSSPLLFALAAVSAAVAMERDLTGLRGVARTPLWGRLTWSLTLVCIALLLVVNMRKDPWVLLGLALALVTVLAFRRSVAPGAVAGLWLLSGAVAAYVFFGSVRLDAEVPAEEAGLSAWARTETPAEALFIVPPGFQEFRTDARRGVYADFKIASMSQPALVSEWMGRLTLIAQPDGLAKKAKGWEAMDEWDRCYAARSSPARIAFLLRTTGSDFFVRDREGLKIPPFVDVPHEDSADLETVFANQRFTVYRLRDHAGPETTP